LAREPKELFRAVPEEPGCCGQSDRGHEGRGQTVGEQDAQTSPAMNRVWLMATKYLDGPAWLRIWLRAQSLEETIEFANTRGRANAACISTSSGASAREFKYKVKPSMVGVNIGIAAPMSFFPFGGAGESMYGSLKGQGHDVFKFFTDTKVTINRWF